LDESPCWTLDLGFRRPWPAPITLGPSWLPLEPWWDRNFVHVLIPLSDMDCIIARVKLKQQGELFHRFCVFPRPVHVPHRPSSARLVFSRGMGGLVSTWRFSVTIAVRLAETSSQLRIGAHCRFCGLYSPHPRTQLVQPAREAHPAAAGVAEQGGVPEPARHRRRCDGVNRESKRLVEFATTAATEESRR